MHHQLSASKASFGITKLKEIVAGAESVECSGHGSCDLDTGVCTCDDSWSSLDCAIRNMVCPTVVVNASCSGHGTCDTTVGVCECDMMWCGEACGQRCNNCPGEPSCGGEGHGFVIKNLECAVATELGRM